MNTLVTITLFICVCVAYSSALPAAAVFSDNEAIPEHGETLEAQESRGGGGYYRGGGYHRGGGGYHRGGGYYRGGGGYHRGGGGYHRGGGYYHG